MSTHHNVIIAFDFGQRRIGCAVGQDMTETANPLGTAKNSNSGPDWHRIGEWIKEWKPSTLVVGMPNHADGSKSTIAYDIEAFIRVLSDFDIPIETIDESETSIEAKEILKKERQMGIKKKIKKEMIDAQAATLIAERWLNKNS
ncbi:MAG: Holliday junction resolvase RuvX [Pseudomonadota bacterium]|nr:Holliday junction resolvase RuvX [Pseudomonadota bacterium]